MRLAEFDNLFASYVEEVSRIDLTTLDLTMAATGREPAEDLVTRETDCCSFFTFDLTAEAGERLNLRVTVPAAYVTVLDALAARAAEVGAGSSAPDDGPTGR
jgi:hypothetical protein